MAKEKKISTLGIVLRRMFGIKTKELDIMQEEAVQSPGRVAARNFFHKPTAVFGLAVFLAIFLFIML